MTLKYESEILFDLMKRDGDNNPSDVLPYESELKEKYLQQVEGAYPKLQDYRPEWLNYNLSAHLPSGFPVETLSDVTQATIDNVVPYAYGKAILKGQTLVNLSSNNYALKNASKIENGFKFDGKTVNTDHILTFQVQAKSDTYYTYIFNSDTDFEFMSGYDATDNDGWVQPTYRAIIGLNVIKVKTEVNNENKNLAFRTTSNRVGNKDVLLTNFMLLEGDHTSVDIHYFTGMKSVQMPVLTTTGENVLNPEKFAGLKGSLESNDGVIINVIKQTNDQNMRVLYENMNLPLNTYTITAETVNGKYLGGALRIYDDKNEFTYEFSIDSGKASATVSSSISQLKMWNPYGVDCQIRIAITTNGSTTYEPYKSNILTVNEEIVLGSVGSVVDTLDLLTGEIVKKTKEVVLDGSENGWNTYWNTNVVPLDNFFTCVINLDGKRRGRAVVDKFSQIELRDEKEGFISDSGGIEEFAIRISKDKLETQDSKGFKKYLSQNPITVRYQLATPTIKTVDLTTTDQDGNTDSIIRPIEGTMHLMTEGESIKPLFSGEIPVEAITQNLASFIEG